MLFLSVSLRGIAAQTWLPCMARIISTVEGARAGSLPSEAISASREEPLRLVNTRTRSDGMNRVLYINSLISK